jgi:hypothetical protein
MTRSVSRSALTSKPGLLQTRSVPLPRHAPFVDLLRLLLREALLRVAVLVDPIRSTFRRRSLERATRSPSTSSSNDASPPLVVLIVYRAKNAHLVRALLGQIDPQADIRLWALDQIDPALAEKTIGCGPGTRFAHLNHLYSAEPITPRSWVVVADDDVFFSKGDMARTIHLMQQSGLSLAQPAQSITGWWSSLFNISRPYLLVRETNYVEQGPIFIADCAMSKEIFPIPEDHSMGWGIEAVWYRIKDGRYRIGIVNDCHMVHWTRAAAGYPTDLETAHMRLRLSSSRVDSIWQLQTDVGAWWSWQRAPSWATTANRVS